MSKIGIQTRGSGAVMRKYLAKGGRIGLPSKRKVFKTHGRDVPTMAAKGGRIGKFGGGRTDLLEELGRVEGERSNPNRRAEISRVHSELNRGYAKGGRAGKYQEAYREPQQKKSELQDFSRKRKGLNKGGKPWGTGPKPGTHEFMMHEIHKPRKKKALGGIAKNIPKLLKRLGKEIKDQPLPPQLQKTLDEVKKLQELQKPRVKKAAGGRIGLKKGQRVPERPKAKEFGGWTKRDPKVVKERPWRTPRRSKRGRELTGDDPIIKSLAGGVKGKPHSSKEGRYASAKRKFGRMIDDTKYDPNPFKAGRALHKKGGKTDKKWIQKAVNPKHKGYCTPMTKKTCTPARKALARTFKKKAKTGWG